MAQPIIPPTTSANQATAPRPRTWLILGERAGDNAQVMALGRVLGWPTEIKQIRYDDNEATEFKDRGASLVGIDRADSTPLSAPWPEAVIAIGRRSVPVVRWIQKQAREAGGDVLLIHLGRPRADLGLFDLVVTTPQYNLPAAPNVMEISLPIVFVDGAELAKAAGNWHARFEHLPRPWHAVLVGGPTPQLSFGRAEAERLVTELSDWHKNAGGSLLVTTSPRTVPEALTVLRDGFAGHSQQLLMPFEAGGDNPYRALLALADDFVISIDSASMVAEAATRRKPIYLFDLPKIAPRKKPGLQAALSRNWRLRRKERQEAGLPADWGDRLYDAWTRQGKARPRRDIGQLLRRLTEAGIAQPLTGETSGQPAGASPGPEREIAAVLARIHALWDARMAEPPEKG